MGWIEHLWQMRHGFSECAPLSSTCVIDWAAAGGWAAAVATFLAVLLPYYREKRRARLRYMLTMGTYARSLEKLARRLDSISSARSILQSGTYSPPKRELELIFGLDFEFPVLEVEPELEAVILATNKLRESVENWRRATQSFAYATQDPVPPKQIENMSPMLDAITDQLHERLEVVQADIERVFPGSGRGRKGRE